MTGTPPVGFVALGRPTFDVILARQQTELVREQLAQAGYKLVGPVDLVMAADDVERAVSLLTAASPVMLIALQATFADSTMILRLADTLSVPLLLWALPEERTDGRLHLNSFCGINLDGHALRRAGHDYEYIYAPPGDTTALEKVSVLYCAAEVRRRLQGTHIGRVGENPAGFPACDVNYGGLKDIFGIEIDQIALPDLFQQVRQVEADTVSAIRRELESVVAGLDTVDQPATAGTLATYATLRQMASERQVAGFAVRCWPEFFTDLGCAACGALSLMSNQQMPCSCEADVNGTITQLMLQWISGEQAFGTDVVAFDPAEEATIVWHCGQAPLSMADPVVPPHATIHSNRKLPLLMEFTLKPGVVTIARLSEATGSYRLVIGRGTMVQAPPSFSGTSGTLRFESGTQHVMDTIMREGLEHHISLTYGDHVAVLEQLARLLHIPVLRL